VRLFGRKNDPDDPAEAIARFWSWWEENRPALDRHAASGDTEALAELLGPAVAALHPSLIWEVTPGKGALHALVVSAAADPELRPLAHRWAKAAPPADAFWEFYPSRQASSQPAEVSFEVNGLTLDLGRLVMALHVPPGSPRVNITAYHPIFPDLDDDTRMEATLLALDRLLGEDEVARWVGDIVAATSEPIDAFAAIHLPAVVADVAEGFTEEQWVALEGRTNTGRRLTAAARFPLRPVDFPLYDQHIAITLPYRDTDDEGQPVGGSAEALREFEERLVKRLTELGDAVLVAHVSAEGCRVLHVYADPEGGAAEELRRLAAGWPEGQAGVDVTADPAWSAVAPFLS